MAPHLGRAAISLLRCPEGAGRPMFLSEACVAGIAADRLHLVPEDGDKILSLDDLDGLLSLVQPGCWKSMCRGRPSNIWLRRPAGVRSRSGSRTG